MPETPIEKLMGWLTREEEEFGLTGAVERTIDPEACRRMLAEELRKDPADVSEAQVELMHAAGRFKYEAMPRIGAGTEMITTYRGTIRERTELWYRDVATGRRLGLADVESRLGEIGWYPAMPLH